MGIYLFGDIHGNLRAYRIIKDYLERELKENDQVICVGDLIDRGPDSAKIMIDYSMLMQSDPRYHFIFGNHEWMLAKAFTTKAGYISWFKNGGTTLTKELHNKADPKLYEEFFDSFYFLLESGVGRIYLRTKHAYVITHSGMTTQAMRDKGSSRDHNPKIYARLWSRAGDSEEKQGFSKLRRGIHLDNTHRKYHVFGHSAKSKDDIDRRWNQSYDSYAKNQEFFLPLDTGLCKKHTGNDAHVALGYIAGANDSFSRPHRVFLFPTLGETLEYKKDSKFRDSYFSGRFFSMNENYLKKWGDECLDGAKSGECFLRSKQIAYTNSRYRNIVLDDYRSLSTSLNSPIIEDLPLERESNGELYNYIIKRRKESTMGRHALWVSKSFQKQSKVDAACWAYAIIFGIIDKEDVTVQDAKTYYKALMQGRLNKAVKNTFSKGGDAIGESFLKNLKQLVK
ncbi:metallophosphoesterase [Lentisphaerota bacterium ZTH]|nr:metallophosphoesterase [Lentisphaerota bacterium]WET05323.1 metallophosphoesterase [Lentisphaerota bacterium ZTH]